MEKQPERKQSEVRSQKSEVRNPGSGKKTHVKIASKNIPPTANSKPKTEEMEVHHHPEIEKKGLKEYLLEGLMIFLAVTMGFFAETIRERISDNAKGREYIRSFVQDLRTDTADFSAIVAYDEKKIQDLNGLSTCADALEKDPKATSCLVPLMESSSSNRHVGFIDGTMQQLKNAGGFRLLSKTDKDSIVAYDHAVGTYKDFENTIFQERQGIVRNVFVKLMNFKAVEELQPGTLKGQTGVPLLFSNDKPLLNEYLNDLLFYKTVTATQDSKIKRLKIRAAGMTKYFEHKDK
ncbi:MAG: hypothetical protein M3N14_12315 [Bacteroidota bacterium]|nr:hypothetical protein [Bacteroidota bacterium]